MNHGKDKTASLFANLRQDLLEAMMSFRATDTEPFQFLFAREPLRLFARDLIQVASMTHRK